MPFDPDLALGGLYMPFDPATAFLRPVRTIARGADFRFFVNSWRPRVAAPQTVVPGLTGQFIGFFVHFD